MNEHAVNNIEQLEVALSRAIDDQAVVQFDTLPSLLAQLPEDLRPAVRAAMDRQRPFEDGAVFFIAHLRLDDDPDGKWGIAKCFGAHAGYALLVACNEVRYREAIRRIHDAHGAGDARLELRRRS